MRDVVIGTAGHIDHGKTMLVRALTGIDTDQLAEEKRRGITIDLGFAHLELPGGASAGIVDVPGHEDFIRNMVAGAAGVDVALLVVAADEGVMPQTREHVAILRMLGVERAVVALTKCDLVDPDWLALAADDLSSHLADTTFADAPALPVSARTGMGLDALLAALADAASSASARPDSDLFRLPIDRAFTIRGTGTVVTGTVRDGVVSVGDALRVMPANVDARVRGIECHGVSVERAGTGARAALALAGLDREHAGRGSWVVSEGWPLSLILTTRLRLIDGTAWQIRQRQRVRVHIGTAEVMARVVLLDRDRITAGQDALAQLRLESPVLARRGDRFVVRSYSPVTTIGGGMVLEPMTAKRRRLTEADRALLGGLEHDARAALPSLVEAAQWRGLPIAELPLRLGIPTIHDLPEHSEVVRIGDRLITRARFEQATRLLATDVRAWHRSHPLRAGMEHAEARRRLDAETGGFADAVIEGAIRDGLLESRDGALAAPGFRPRADAGQVAARERLEGIYRGAGLAPPRFDELPGELADRSELRDLLALLEKDGVLLPFPPDRLIHAEVLADARTRLLAALSGRRDLGPADFRALFDLPRKHLIPLLELFDRLGWTRREGDRRMVP
ncbi:MAG TPA: selenocysteine-specific translation elongation factor [Longimicrobiales bacterium]|nr:selenocysteine-specific translation elongation factor [Longimicrobiales bacterium]